MYFFCIPPSIADAAAVIPNGAKTFFAIRIATFINRPANLLNNDPKKTTLDYFRSLDFRKF